MKATEKILEKVRLYKKGILTELYDQLTESQKSKFHLIYGNLETILEDKISDAIDLCERTVNKNMNEKKEENPGIIYIPYVMKEHTYESLKEYKEFMDEYKKQHKLCPKCGSESHSTTLTGYIVNWDKKEEYKDLNRCICQECGDVHITHERVSKIKFDSELLVYSNMLLEDSIYRILWDIFKYGWNYGNTNSDYRNEIENINQILREVSEKIINHIKNT